jgi:hypothetical protein
MLQNPCSHGSSFPLVLHERHSWLGTVKLRLHRDAHHVRHVDTQLAAAVPACCLNLADAKLARDREYFIRRLAA